jgi:alpha-D-xyloside xylohydrolase
MLLEFPDDPACETLDRQYMLGPSLLVAPVFSEEGDVSFYLPDGKWTHLLTGEIVEGGRWRKEKHNFMSLPLYGRPHSLIAWGGYDNRPDYDFADGAIFAAYGLDDGVEVGASIPDEIGEEAFRLTVRRDGAAVHVTASLADVAWTLSLPKGLVGARTEGATLSVKDGGIVTVQGRGSITIGVSEVG